MVETGEKSIIGVLKSFRCGDRRDVLRENPEATVRRLVLAAIEFNYKVVRDFGGKEGGTRGRELVEQTIGAAFQTFGGKEIHSGDFDKAAMLFRGIAGGHPFGDGNKRTAFLLAAYFLEETGHSLPENLPVDKLEDLCLKVSSGDIRDAEVISRSLRTFWRFK